MKMAMAAVGLAVAVTVLVLSGLPAPAGAAGGGEKAAAAGGETEVTKDSNLLLTAKLPVANLTVYGVKLGDSIEKIPAVAGVTRQTTERQQDEVFTGRNVSYYANEGKIYRIRVHGELTEAMPPYDYTRLQMLLGKADEAATPETNVISLTYFARRARFVFHASQTVSSVDFYAP